MATNSSAIQKKIETLKKGLNNKFITAAQKEKIKAQVEKLQTQAKASAPKKASKPAATSLTRLQKMVNKKKYGIYKGAGVDLQKDSDRPAKAIGKRTSKSGKTYYEYRANRIDVKQPPKKYPKLEEGGYMAKGGEIYSGKDIKITIPKMGKFDEQKVVAVYDKDNFIFKIYDKDKKRVLTKMGGTNFESNLMNGSYKMDGYMAKGGRVDDFSNKIQEGDIVWDSGNNSYGVVLNTYDFKYGEIRLDSDGNQPEENLHKLGSKGDKGTKEKLKAALLAHKSLITKYPEMGYEKVNYAKGGYMADGGAVKGRNNQTGESYGVVIGSVQKADDEYADSIKMNVRNSYESRICESSVLFDKNGNLITITDYGCAYDGKYPSTGVGSGRNYYADKKETLQILSKKYNPAFAKRLIELAKNPKMAEGGMTEHGLKIGDTIVDNIFWDDSIKVLNNKTGYAVVDLENGERKDEMEKGGETKVDRERMYNFLKDDLASLEKAIEANNQEEIDKFFSYWSYHLSSLEPKTGSKRMYEFLKDDLVGLEAATKELPSSKEETDRFFSYWNIHLSSLEPKMEKGGYMAEGGVTAKEVVESNADMVLSQIKAVKHHAEELSSVVSRKSNIEAWVVGKIERASTDLSDITHYLEGNKDKMSMGGAIRHYAHKMDKK
jgi:hypothetical protein